MTLSKIPHGKKEEALTEHVQRNAQNTRTRISEQGTSGLETVTRLSCKLEIAMSVKLLLTVSFSWNDKVNYHNKDKAT